MVAVLNLLPPLFTLLSSFSFADGRKTDAQAMQLHGKVRTVKETSYNAVDSGNMVVKGVKIDPTMNINDMHYLFNENGNFTEQMDYASDQRLLQRIVYVYNAYGQITEERVENGDKSLNHKETVVHRDARGNKLETKLVYSSLSSPFKVTFKYDANNNPTETCIFHDGEIFLKFQSRYDVYNREIENWDITAGERYLYKYDDLGNRIEEAQYNQNGELLTKKISVYDSNRHKTEIRKYGNDGKLMFTANYTYTVDEKKNWIRKVEYYNGKPLLITERIIEYYP